MTATRGGACGITARRNGNAAVEVAAGAAPTPVKLTVVASIQSHHDYNKQSVNTYIININVYMFVEMAKDTTRLGWETAVDLHVKRNFKRFNWGDKFDKKIL